ncbi:hypothetical protein SAMN02745857_03835 [Andreprevotia lacus DSM 23236]|jgi:hypothetical protein|uniref:ABC-type amino acid transport substrate-binding protein n=1 Tax=Andreprevotia lacus DSM 23236 TaxID=1121001 RepID=A0A1W1XZZ1_9NEIS|nr:transporter substrate-binding domain-containing protein [Andreprevotia lacus]SMC29437.1 hypothetical protein SAMN02745857_03835 [Andreprevotia lacus DSM 23236]
MFRPKCPITPRPGLYAAALAALLAGATVQAARVSIISSPGIIDEEGRGFFPELAQILYGDEIDVHASMFPPSRAIWVFEGRKADVLFAMPVCRMEGASYLRFGLHDYELFVGRVGQPLPKPGDNLAGKTIAVVGGLAHPLRKRQPDWKWYETRDYQQALRMLAAGRVDYVYGFAFLMDQVMTDLKLNSQLRYDLGRPFDQVIPALAVHNDAAGLAEAKRLEVRFRAMVSDGSYLRLMRSYGYPMWYYQDGLNGRIGVTLASDCPAE